MERNGLADAHMSAHVLLRVGWGGSHVEADFGRDRPPLTILRNKNGHPQHQIEILPEPKWPASLPSHARREPPVKDDPVSPAAELIGCALLVLDRSQGPLPTCI